MSCHVVGRRRPCVVVSCVVSSWCRGSSSRRVVSRCVSVVVVSSSHRCVVESSLCRRVIGRRAVLLSGRRRGSSLCRGVSRDVAGAGIGGSAGAIAIADDVAVER
jgi:hypothetical protein